MSAFCGSRSAAWLKRFTASRQFFLSIAVLPAEVNLGVHYADADAAGLNEANFTIARLDTSANQWRAVAKQAPDPPSNLTSATITEMGFYVLHQRS